MLNLVHATFSQVQHFLIAYGIQSRGCKNVNFMTFKTSETDRLKELFSQGSEKSQILLFKINYKVRLYLKHPWDAIDDHSSDLNL